MKTRLETVLENHQTADVPVPHNQMRSYEDGLGDGDDFRIGANGRFLLDATATDLILLKGKTSQFRAWLDAREVNKLLKRAQSCSNTKEMLIELLARCYGMMMVQEEIKYNLQSEMGGREEQVEHLGRKCTLMQEKLESEEEAKRRTLLRYVHAVKSAAPGKHGAEKQMLASKALGTIQLPESAISDEELHAIAALLRCDNTIQELTLRNNMITDDGAHALASVLAGKSSLTSVDLRGNMITHHGIRTIAEALERAERVRHVYVHAGGKVEALGVCRWGSLSKESNASANVETICCVDCRDNKLSLESDNNAVAVHSPAQGNSSKPSKHQPIQVKAHARHRGLNLSKSGREKAWSSTESDTAVTRTNSLPRVARRNK